MILGNGDKVVVHAVMQFRNINKSLNPQNITVSVVKDKTDDSGVDSIPVFSLRQDGKQLINVRDVVNLFLENRPIIIFLLRTRNSPDGKSGSFYRSERSDMLENVTNVNDVLVHVTT